jgi:hypothetical protein
MRTSLYVFPRFSRAEIAYKVKLNAKCPRCFASRPGFHALSNGAIVFPVSKPMLQKNG